MDLIYIFVVLLNYFWLSYDPDESASMYCDQHCFKIGAELMESIWDVVLVLSPELSDEATNLGIPATNRKQRHSKKDCLWHPLSVWNGLCRANLHRSLLNANSIFQEHYRRRNTTHKAWADCKFLLGNYKRIDFNSKIWEKWFMSQSGDEKYKPAKTKLKDLKIRKQWCSVHAVLNDKSLRKLDRNTCKMTEPPRCINEKEFPGCKDEKDVVSAYKLYYHYKVSSMGQGMRYYYSDPPLWLKRKNCPGIPSDFNEKIHTRPKSKTSKTFSPIEYRKIVFIKPKFMKK